MHAEHFSDHHIKRQKLIPFKSVFQLLLPEKLVPHDGERAPQLVVAALLGDVRQKVAAKLDPTLEVGVGEADPEEQGPYTYRAGQNFIKRLRDFALLAKTVSSRNP